MDYAPETMQAEEQEEGYNEGKNEDKENIVKLIVGEKIYSMESKAHQPEHAEEKKREKASCKWWKKKQGTERSCSNHYQDDYIEKGV